MNDEALKLAERIEGQHLRDNGICCKCSSRNDSVPWPCDAIEAASLLRESAQREAAAYQRGLQAALKVCEAKAAEWDGADDYESGIAVMAAEIFRRAIRALKEKP